MFALQELQSPFIRERLSGAEITDKQIILLEPNKSSDQIDLLPNALTYITQIGDLTVLHAPG